MIDKIADTPHNQDESIATRYMNRYSIVEDDQFEIAAFRTVYRSATVNQKDVFEKLEKTMQEAMQAVVNLTMLHTEGLGYFHRNSQFFISFTRK